MNCPNCGNNMEVKKIGKIEIDVCSNCGGIWFDWMELVKLDEKHEGFGDMLNAILNQPYKGNVKRGKVKCPKCNIVMQKHAYKFNKKVEIDECYQCGGIYLDSGELNVIRQTHMSDEERNEFVKKLIQNTAKKLDVKDIPDSLRKFFDL